MDVCMIESSSENFITMMSNGIAENIAIKTI